MKVSPPSLLLLQLIFWIGLRLSERLLWPVRHFSWFNESTTYELVVVSLPSGFSVWFPQKSKGLNLWFYLRMYSYQSRVPPPPPPLSRAVIPSKRPRVSLSGGGSRRTKTSFSSSSKSSQRTSRTSQSNTVPVPLSPITQDSRDFPSLPVSAVRADDLQTIKRELTQIKLKVDYLLESLEHMEKDHSKKSGTSEMIRIKLF